MRLFIFLHLDPILATSQPTPNIEAILCPTYHPTFNPTYHPSCCQQVLILHSSSDPDGQTFPERSPHCLKPTQTLNWCPKRHQENYIKSSEKESAAPKKKRLLRSFPMSLNFKKRYQENYDIKSSSENETAAPKKKRLLRSFPMSLRGNYDIRSSAEKLRKRRKKRLLRNFPGPLHFKKDKEPKGQALNIGGFWKQMFSNP